MAQYNFKGGRTAQLPMRLTPQEKALITEAAKAEGMSATDFLVMLAKQRQGGQLLLLPEKQLDGDWFLHRISHSEPDTVMDTTRFESDDILAIVCQHLRVEKRGQFILWDAPSYTSSPDEPSCIEYDLFDLLNQTERKED